IAEEMGFLGSVLILVKYLLLISYLLRLAQLANNSFNLLVTVGVVSMFLFQVIVNIGMNVGILPITGITLPLISYGGSSLIATFLSLGMAASCAGNKRGNRLT
ncbi:MAG: FtsW/RodA/SpoVE family cell cycle protein, partial [Candidatus Daviesbacteria bacterium]|nr:FtsW/RodA/SpoVE family cell cycle protein [Candidatus Daviesbacteria bacterium]